MVQVSQHVQQEHIMENMLVNMDHETMHHDVTTINVQR